MSATEERAIKWCLLKPQKGHSCKGREALLHLQQYYPTVKTYKNHLLLKPNLSHSLRNQAITCWILFIIIKWCVSFSHHYFIKDYITKCLLCGVRALGLFNEYLRIYLKRSFLTLRSHVAKIHISALFVGTSYPSYAVPHSFLQLDSNLMMCVRYAWRKWCEIFLSWGGPKNLLILNLLIGYKCLAGVPSNDDTVYLTRKATGLRWMLRQTPSTSYFMQHYRYDHINISRLLCVCVCVREREREREREWYHVVKDTQ